MSIFDAYCDDLTFLAQDIRNNLITLKTGEGFEALCKTILTIFDQSADLLKQAEVEARSHESKERKFLNDKLRCHKDVFTNLRAEYDNDVFQMQKSKLTGKSGEDRGRMMDVNEK